MTQAGPAIPVVVSNQPPDGGAALRVAVVSDGRAVDAGPARPIVEVFDNRPTQGNEPVPIVVSRDNGFTLAGPPMPVVVVSGTLGPVIYVRTTGNDTTGNGSTTAPYLTLTKALAVAVAGDTIRVGDGTYAENTAASGAWTIAKSVASDIVIESESGIAANVIITGTSGVNNVIFSGGASAHLKFRSLTFRMRAGTSYGIRFNANCSNLTFDSCLIDATTSSSAIGGIAHVSATAIVTSTAFINCTTTTSPSGGYNGGVYFAPTGTGSIAPQFTSCTLGGVVLLQGSGAGGTFTNCAISGVVKGLRTIGAGTIAISGGSISATTGNAIDANGAAITISNCLISNTGANGTVTFGVDGTSGNTTTGSITNCTIAHNPAVAGHTLLIGAGCSGFIVDGVSALQAYDYACVIKENAGAIVRNCTLVGGSTVAANGALYFKAATGASASNNTLTSGANFGVRLLKGDTGNKCGAVSLQNNRITTVGSAVALEWGDSTNDSGGGVCDFNTYAIHSSGVIGNVRATLSITTLAGLQAAWSGYDVAGNDTHSTVIP